MSNTRYTKYDIPTMPSDDSDYRQKLWDKVHMIALDVYNNVEDVERLKKDMLKIKVIIPAVTAVLTILFYTSKILGL